MAPSWPARRALPFALIQLLATVSAQTLASETFIVSSLSSLVTTTPTPTSTTSSTRSASSSSSSRGPQVHTVKAGSGGFKFEPAELDNVNVGDTVTFEFYPPDHSVARADFMSPCVPYEYTGKDKVGFWSDTQYVDSVDSLKYFNITINSTAPIFYYCAAPDSCIKKDMIGVINPNSTQTLQKQLDAIKDASYQLKPGDPIPAEASSTLHTQTPTTTSTAAPASGGDSHHHGLTGGAIAGIVVGAVAFLVICAALFFYIGRTKSLKEVIDRRDATVKSTTNDGGQPGHASTYGGPTSPGFPPGQFSPTPTHAEYGGQLPAYGQHNATDAHPTGWTSPHQGHLSMSGSPQPQMTEVKDQYPYAPVEMASPGPEQQQFTHELEAPIKAPR